MYITIASRVPLQGVALLFGIRFYFLVEQEVEKNYIILGLCRRACLRTSLRTG